MYDSNHPFSLLGTSPTSPPDERDHHITRYLAVARSSSLPSEVGRANVDDYPGIRDQKWEGSCTGHGYRSVKQTQERRGRKNKRQVPEFGPRGIYQLGKQVGGYPDEEGAYLRDVLKAAAQYGSPLERDWPYRSKTDEAGTHPIGKPRRHFYDSAQRWQVGAYARLGTHDQVVTALHQVGPVYCATTWYESWFYPNADGTVPAPTKDQGGHCYAILLSSEDRSAYLCANSWGAAWGKDGFFWLPWDYFHHRADGEAWLLPDAAAA